MKLSATSAQNSFKYGWLLSRIWPYIKPYWFRILLGFIIAIPLGLLDGVTAFALKPYMDYVINLSENPNAKAVKIADLMHNSDMSRLDTIDEYALKRAEKYK